MSAAIASVIPVREISAEAARREELVRSVANSVTFEKSPRLRAFLVHVCRCALEGRPEKATEQQIGIFVYGRPPGYNQNEDNIVRSQARILRLKLEHHFAHEGKDDLLIITIPKGQYLPVFGARNLQPPAPANTPVPAVRNTRHVRWILLAGAVLVSVVAVGLRNTWLKRRQFSPPSAIVAADPVSPVRQPEGNRETPNSRPEIANDAGAIRIAAGHAGAPYVDAWGHRWGADQFYAGGVIEPGPSQFFPPVPDEGLFRSIREAASDDKMVPQPERNVQYDIPTGPGVYELALYFADPLRQPVADRKEDAQNERHFQILINGRVLLEDLDPIADSGYAPVDVRVFKDIRPAPDGKVHLELRSDWGRAFVSALELIPGIPGKLRPIRIAARALDFQDSDGTYWKGDRYYIDGRTWFFQNPKEGPKIPALYAGERHGNFSYQIPVPPGSYTVRLHFLESFFSPLIPAARCQGAGCRVFDLTCNGIMLLQDFDVFQAAGGAFRPVVREFHGLHPNGQGKLLLSFSPKINYAEIRAIEVLDEAK
jgi:hypothetical protein